MSNIGGRVRAARKAVGLSQEGLARQADVSLNVVSRLERGSIADPHISTLSRIADGLGVPVGELLEDFPKVGAPTSSEPAEVVEARKAIGEALEEVGVEARYLTLSGEELLALYRAAPSREEAERITEGLLSERRALDDLPPHTKLPGFPTQAYFLTRLTALQGLGEVAAREDNMEEGAAMYDRDSQEVNKVFAGAA